MSESQASNVPATVSIQGNKPIRPSILHKLDLLMHYHRRQPAENQRIKSDCSVVGVFRGIAELICLSVTFALAIYRIIQTKSCFSHITDYNYAVLVGFCTALATLAKAFLFLISLTKRARSLFSEVRFTLWKAVVATSYCSHNVPILLINADTCEGENALFEDKVAGLTAVQWFVIGWYAVLIGVSIGLFVVTKCAPKSFAIQKHSETWFWACVRAAQALEALLYLFTVAVMLSLLDKRIGVIYAELASTSLYLLYAAGLLAWRVWYRVPQDTGDTK